MVTKAPERRRPPRRPRRPWFYVLLAVGCFAIAMAAAGLGAVLAEHHTGKLQELPAAVVAFGLVGTAALLMKAYIIGMRDPSLERRLNAMVRPMNADQPVSGSFQAALREAPPVEAPAAQPKADHGELVTWSRPPRWKRGRVQITADAVIWRRRGTHQVRNLTGSTCVGEPRSSGNPYPFGADFSLKLPEYYRGASIQVIRLHTDGGDVELAAPAKLIEITRYSLPRTGGLPASGR